MSLNRAVNMLIFCAFSLMRSDTCPRPGKDDRVGIFHNARHSRSKTWATKVRKVQSFIPVYIFDVRAPCGEVETLSFFIYSCYRQKYL